MPEDPRHCIVSTVGVSLLLNGASEDERALLRRTANARKAGLTAAEREIVAQRAAAARRELAAGEEAARRASAELNGLLALRAIGPHTCHYLLHSDTCQGALAAEVLAEWLRARGAAVTPQVLAGLTSADSASFARGIDALLTWSQAALPGLREQGWRVTFNLSGGFKSLQAYLQTLGMFYADEVVYLFEGEASGLIRIPRLPVTWDAGPLRRHAAAIARLTQGAVLPLRELAGLPEAYLEIDARGDATLSTWGLMAWSVQKKAILAEQLLEQPGLRYTEAFRRDWERRMDGNERAALQEALARTALLWAEGGLRALRADGGLQYETYSRGDETGHFRVSDSLRASCRPEGGALLLRRWGAHDEVNNNP